MFFNNYIYISRKNAPKSTFVLLKHKITLIFMHNIEKSIFGGYYEQTKQIND